MNSDDIERMKRIAQEGEDSIPAEGEEVLSREEMERLSRKKMLADLRSNGKRGTIILEEDDHDVDDTNRFTRIANEFNQIDQQMSDEMNSGDISMMTMEIEKDELVRDEDGSSHFVIGEKEIDVEVIDMRFDEGIKDFLRDEVKAELLGDRASRNGSVDRLTQCPECGSKDVQVMAPPNMYCNSCDKTYSYELLTDDIKDRFDTKGHIPPQDDSKIIFGSEKPDQRKVRRIFRPGE